MAKAKTTQRSIPDKTKLIEVGHKYKTEYLPVNPTALVEAAEGAASILANYEFDTIALRGMSGALMAPILSIILGKPFTMVRKEGEGSHSSLPIEGCISFQTYVIVDDFVVSGETARICIGILQYMRLHKYTSGGTLTPIHAD